MTPSSRDYHTVSSGPPTARSNEGAAVETGGAGGRSLSTRVLHGRRQIWTWLSYQRLKLSEADTETRRERERERDWAGKLYALVPASCLCNLTAHQRLNVHENQRKAMTKKTAPSSSVASGQRFNQRAPNLTAKLFPPHTHTSHSASSISF